MVIYEDYGKNGLGWDLIRAYSDEGFFIERDEILYPEAIDPAFTERTYTETNIPIEDNEATPEDYEEALREVGVLNEEE